MCDTFVALPPATADGSVIFGKNSDREPNEAQTLEYHPAVTWPDGATVRCTYLGIPQVKETRAVLISRPFWMWGAEMGGNEKGVVIGNEAVFTKMPVDKKGGLTGMDLLRLALERSDTAPQAMETIIRLLADYGQGGICGYEDKRMAYHNSFIIADPGQAWILQTAGPLWAALEVKDIYSISNGLTIGREFDQHHPELIETARKRGWLKRGETFDFAKVYSDWFFTTFSASRARRGRSYGLLDEARGKIDPGEAIGILRDHRDPEYSPDSHFLLDRICAHGANKLSRNAAQSTGSLVAHLKPGMQTFWVTGTSAPCTGIFKPVWFEGEVLPDIGPSPEGTYDPRTLWWRHKELHRSILLDYSSRMEAYRSERDELEASYLEQAREAGPGERWTLTRTAFSQSIKNTERWTRLIQEFPIRFRPKWIYRNFWKR